ncbi:hypothetical protein PG988_007375 [Apiospora saccharicola]
MGKPCHIAAKKKSQPNAICKCYAKERQEQNPSENPKQMHRHLLRSSEGPADRGLEDIDRKLCDSMPNQPSGRAESRDPRGAGDKIPRSISASSFLMGKWLDAFEEDDEDACRENSSSLSSR